MLRDLEGRKADSNSTQLPIELLERSPSPVTFIATGPLTNIADVFAKRPDLLRKVHRLVVMGGALDVPGNVPEPLGRAVAEYNFFVDPASANRVLALAEDGLDITLVPLDLTNELPLSVEWLQRLKTDRSSGARLAVGILQSVEPQIATGEYYLWDGAAVLALLDPRSLRFESAALEVRHTEPEQGRLGRASARTSPIRIAVGVTESSQPLERALEWLSNARPGW